MLTALDIIEPNRQNLFYRLRNLLSSNRIRVEHRYCDRAAVKIVTYEHRRKKVNFSAIDRFVKAQRNHLLCPPTLQLPQQLGYRRFESDRLCRRLSENAALFLIKELGRDVARMKVAVFDESGFRAALVERLLGLCESVTVVTKATAFYLDEARRIIAESGAVLRVSKTAQAVKDADLILSESDVPLKTKQTAVVLSPQQLTRLEGGICFFGFSIALDPKLEELMPAFLDPMYFAEALYVLGKVYELGEQQFRFCCQGEMIHTPQSLLQLLRERLKESCSNKPAQSEIAAPPEEIRGELPPA